MGNNLDKYIVYVTINLKNWKIYIGQHKLSEGKEDYYLGNGCYGNKPNTYAHPKYPFQYAVKKYGPKNFRRITIAEFESEQEALTLESILVNDTYLKRSDVYNIALGGGKLPNTKKEIHQYNLNGQFIQSWESVISAGQKLKVSKSSISNAVNQKTTAGNFYWSYDKVDCLDLSKFYVRKNPVTIYLYDSTGTYVDSFTTCAAASQYLNCPGTLIMRALKTKIKVRGYYVSDFKYEQFPIPEKFTIKNKPVYQYDISGAFVKAWENVTSVWKFFKKKSSSTLICAIKRQSLFEGYQWRVEKFDSIPAYQAKRVFEKKKVGMFSREGKLIKVYDTVSEARRYYGTGMWRNLKGITPYYKNYVFKYI